MSKKVQSFPYGQFTISDDWKSTYRDVIDGYQLPYSPHRTAYPLKQPVLQTLQGRYSINDRSLPSEWTYTVNAYVSDPFLKYFLSTLTIDEYIEGKIDDKRWKSFRESLLSVDKKKYPQSSKIGGLLKDYRSLDRIFNNRGTIASVGYDMIITGVPQHFIYMSNGQDWTSCQHYAHGSYRSYIEGNMVDPYSVLAIIIEKDKCIDDKDSIIARTILRTLHTFYSFDPVFYIDNFYSNNDFARNSLIRSLLKLLQTTKQEVYTGYSCSILDELHTGDSQQLNGYPVDVSTVRRRSYQDLLSDFSLESNVYCLRASTAYELDLTKFHSETTVEKMDTFYVERKDIPTVEPTVEPTV